MHDSREAAPQAKAGAHFRLPPLTADILQGEPTLIRVPSCHSAGPDQKSFTAVLEHSAVILRGSTKKVSPLEGTQLSFCEARHKKLGLLTCVEKGCKKVCTSRSAYRGTETTQPFGWESRDKAGELISGLAQKPSEGEAKSPGSSCCRARAYQSADTSSAGTPRQSTAPAAPARALKFQTSRQ